MKRNKDRSDPWAETLPGMSSRGSFVSAGRVAEIRAINADKKWGHGESAVQHCDELLTEVDRLTDAPLAAREEGLVEGFADCEALVVAMLTAMARNEAEKASKRAAQGIEREGHETRAHCLREAALAVQLGQHRTDAYDAEQLATAHRKAAGLVPGAQSKGGTARHLALSPERRREIAKTASDAAQTARRAKKGE